MDSVFLRGVALSGLLHAGAIAYAVIVMPDRLAKLPPGTEPIAVEVVDPRDVARLPAAEASRDETPQIAQADTAAPAAPSSPPSDDGDGQRVAALPAPARTETAAREKPRSGDAESGPEPAIKPATASPDEASSDAVADEAAGRSTNAEAAPESVAPPERPRQPDQAIARRRPAVEPAGDEPADEQTLPKPILIRTDSAPPAAAVADAGRASGASAGALRETSTATPQSSDVADAPRTRDRQAFARPRESDATSAPLPPSPKKKQPVKKPAAKDPPVQQARRVEPPKQKRKPPPDAGFPLCGSLLPKLETRLRRSDCASVRNLLNHTLETSRSGQMGIWKSPDRSYLGKVLPMESFIRPDGIPCREFIQTLQMRGDTRVASGTACRDRVRPVWRIVM